jgi:acetyl esterase/lipase
MVRRHRYIGASRALSLVVAVAGVLVGAVVLAAQPGLPAAVLDRIPTGSDAVLGDHYPAVRVRFPGGVVGLPALTYAVVPGYRPLHLDLYLPPGKPARRPLVIYIHGGGWMAGHPRQSGAFANWPDVLALIASRGYVVASVEYRLSGEARFPAAIQDVKAAIRWLRAHGDQYGIDPGRVLVWGGSAGGHLAALAGVSCGVASLNPTSEKSAQIAPAGPDGDCVQGVVSWYGIFDFHASRPGSGGGPVKQFLGCAEQGCTDAQLAAASPATYVKAGEPPMLLIVGSADSVVGAQQSRDFDALLRSKGDPVQLLIIPGVNHSFVGPTAARTRAASLEALQRTFEFIQRTVGQGGSTAAR